MLYKIWLNINEQLNLVILNFKIQSFFHLDFVLDEQNFVKISSKPSQLLELIKVKQNELECTQVNFGLRSRGDAYFFHYLGVLSMF